MMRYRKDDNTVGCRAIEDREAESLRDDPARIGAGKGAREREGDGAGRGLLYCRGKTLAQAGLRFIVVHDLG